MRRLPVVAALLFAWLGTLLLCSPTLGRVSPEYPKPLPEGVYVSDRAVILTIGDVTRLNKAAAEVFNTSGVPVMVVTISSIEDMGGDPAGGIEPYALGLFNNWGIGSAKDNRGVLLLLSKGDSKARIQLGSAWPTSQDAVTQKIMDTTIVPAVKRGAYGQGLVAGVEALGEMIAESNAARRQSTPPSTTTSPPPPASASPPAVAPPAASFFDLPLVVPGLVCGGIVIVLGAVALAIRAVMRRNAAASSMGYGVGPSAGTDDTWSGGDGGSGGGSGGGDDGGAGGGGGGASSGGGSTGSC